MTHRSALGLLRVVGGTARCARKPWSGTVVAVHGARRTGPQVARRLGWHRGHPLANRLIRSSGGRRKAAARRSLSMEAVVKTRQARKMMQQIAAGEAAEVTSAMASIRKLARLASIAEQFGYDYAGVRQGGGPQGNGLVMLLMPDPSPRARTQAARTWTHYPNAAAGGPLPPLQEGTVHLLRARIGLDLAARYSEKQLIALAGFGFTVAAVVLGIQLGAGIDSWVVAGTTWVALIALVPVLLRVNRRYRARCTAILEAVGYRHVRNQHGGSKLVPPVSNADMATEGSNQASQAMRHTAPPT